MIMRKFMVLLLFGAILVTLTACDNNLPENAVVDDSTEIQTTEKMVEISTDFSATEVQTEIITETTLSTEPPTQPPTELSTEPISVSPTKEEVFSTAIEKHYDYVDRVDRKSTRLNSSHPTTSRMPSSA